MLRPPKSACAKGVHPNGVPERLVVATNRTHHDVARGEKLSLSSVHVEKAFLSRVIRLTRFREKGQDQEACRPAIANSFSTKTIKVIGARGV